MSEKTAKRLAKGLIAIEGGRVYDMSLWKAIYRTIWREWWLAVVLNGIGSESLRPLHELSMLTRQVLCGLPHR